MPRRKPAQPVSREAGSYSARRNVFLPACTGTGAQARGAPELPEQAHDPGPHRGHPVRCTSSVHVQQPAALTDQAMRPCPRSRRRRLTLRRASQELAALPGRAVELPAADDVIPLSSGDTQAMDTLRRSDFFRECMAPRTASFKVLTGGRVRVRVLGSQSRAVSMRHGLPFICCSLRNRAGRQLPCMAWAAARAAVAGARTRPSLRAQQYSQGTTQDMYMSACDVKHKRRTLAWCFSDLTCISP